MLVRKVTDAVRRRLGDIRKERWSDDQLILYTSLCQTDICIFTNFYRQEALIDLEDDTLIYDLPLDCIRVERLEYAGEFFPIESRNTIDSGKAQFPCALKDNLPFNKIEIVLGSDYTLLSQALENMFGVVSDQDTEGVDTSGCELEDTFGVVSDIDAGSITPINIGQLKVYYSAVPPLMDTLDDTLIVPDFWLSAFIHYVSGAALQDDNDANNIQRGEQELAKYNRMLAQIAKTTAKDFTTNYKSKLVTDYRRV